MSVEIINDIVKNYYDGSILNRHDKYLSIIINFMIITKMPPHHFYDR